MATCRLSTANSESSRATAASARTVCASSTSIASGTWRPITATVSGAPSAALVMMPAFSPAIPAMSSPRYSTWSTLIGVMTATGALTTLVASQRPPRPTSITATSIGASANAANAIAVSTSNLLIAGPPMIRVLEMIRFRCRQRERQWDPAG